MSRTRRDLLAGRRGAPGEDAAALTRVLAAQSLSLACYERVIGAPVLDGASSLTHRVLADIRGQERAHVVATRAALTRLGHHPVGLPADVQEIDSELAAHHVGGRPGRLRGPLDALGLLLAVERVAVGAAYVALATVRDPGTSLLIAQAMASDAQHEALLQERTQPGDVADAIPYGTVHGLK